MFLDKLIIEKESRIIREVCFKKGLNLIVDETPNAESITGNNVGKTTMIKVIDYCLCGKMDEMFKDKETNTVNSKVKEFLQSPKVRIKLRLKGGSDKEKYEIVRSYDKGYLINNKEKTESELKKELGEILFKLQSGTPTLRETIGKFIRIRNYQLDSVYRYLHPSAPNANSTYENIYLHLLGFSDHKTLELKRSLLKTKKAKESDKKVLSKYSRGALDQIIRALNKDIDDIEESLKSLNVSDSVKKEFELLKKVRGDISQASIDISNINTRIELSEKTISDLEKTKSSINPDMIKEIYEQAKYYIPKLQKSFENVLQFHNTMIENKIKFVKKSLSPLCDERKKLETELEKLYDKETSHLSKISRKGALDGLKNCYDELASLKEKRGEAQGILHKQEKVEKELKELDNELEAANHNLLQFKDKLDEELETFNSFYRNISKQLYDEECVFSGEFKKDSGYKFSVTSMPGSAGTVGSGKKKGQAMAFDLAYLKFLESKKANICRFQINDRVEEVHINQLKTAFEIANNTDGQFMIPILRERISELGDSYIEKNKIISLSQEEKFFKL